MKITIAIVTIVLVGAVVAKDPVYIGCYHDCGRGCSQFTRNLPTYYCENDKRISGGCGAEPNDPPYASAWAGGDAMTPQLCSSICSGFKFFGVQAGSQCFCGNDYGNQGGKAPDSECTKQCTGNTTLVCGGPSRNSVYAQQPGW
jgi:hypothetical protein